MSNTTFAPGPTPNTVRSPDGKVLTVPKGWILLPPGDAALTRRVKAAGDHWVVAEKKGRRVFTRGVWAPATTIDQIRIELDAERSTESFAKKKASDARRRDQAQAEYVEDFYGAVVAFLAFHPNHADIAERLARAVADHATPVGSGTVARTKRIPVERRAEAAVIAWMRHQTTGYDGMAIPRVKGKRREVRRMLAQRSTELLARYRRGDSVGENCPLQEAVAEMAGAQRRTNIALPIKDGRSAKTVLFLCRANHYRSRFAEIFFNWHAAQQDLPWRAESRGLNLDPLNPGHLSRHAISRLLLLEIPVDDYRRNPQDLALADLKSAHHIVAVQGTEHRPLITARFPKWLDKIEYWEVHDIDFTGPEQALPQLEREITGLLERLKTSSAQRGLVKLSKGRKPSIAASE